MDLKIIQPPATLASPSIPLQDFMAELSAPVQKSP